MWHGNEKLKEQLLQCQQQTERLEAMPSARSWETMRVFSPLVRVFSLQFVHRYSNRLLLMCRLFETDVKIESEGRNATSNGVNVTSIHLFPVYLCQRVRQGEWIKKPSTHQNPVVSVVAVEFRPWACHQSQSLPQPSALLLSRREFCIHKQKLDKAFCQSSPQPKRWGGSLASLTSTGFGRSAQQNTAAKYVGLGAQRTNTPTKALHNNRGIPAQATSSLLHSATANR